LPSGQFTQYNEPDALLNFPTSHNLQLSMSAVPWYLATGQSSHVAAPLPSLDVFTKCPGKQRFRQYPSLGPEHPDLEPMLHESHGLQSAVPVSFWNFVPGHALHSLVLLGLNFPTGQPTQKPLSETCPALHGKHSGTVALLNLKPGSHV
jgi:hypothetical protein